MSAVRHFEDFRVGQRFVSPARAVPREEIVSFTRHYDPQSFGPDDAPGEDIAASGWHIALVTMALALHCEIRPVAGFASLGVDAMRWPRCVRPGDQLRLEATVKELRAHRSRADAGVLRLRMISRNQHDDIVFDCLKDVLVPRRHPARRRAVTARAWALMA